MGQPASALSIGDGFKGAAEVARPESADKVECLSVQRGKYTVTPRLSEQPSDKSMREM